MKNIKEGNNVTKTAVNKMLSGQPKKPETIYKNTTSKVHNKVVKKII